MRLLLALLLATQAAAGDSEPAPTEPAAAEPAPAEPETTEEDAQARELFERGWDHYDSGRYEAAIELWRAAHTLSPRPLILFNIGNALERLGHLQEAISTLERYLGVAPSDEIATIEARLVAMRARLEPQNEPSPTRNLAGPISLFGLAAVGLGAGAVFGTRALDARTEARQGCSAQPAHCQLAVEDALARDRSNSAFADLSMAVGVISLGAGTGWLLLSSPRAKQTSIQAVISPDRVGVTGRF
jgi:tetratricopeptide (TPR) repeat protein